MVVLLWLGYCGGSTVVVVLWLWYCGGGIVVVVLWWWYMIKLLFKTNLGSMLAHILTMWGQPHDPDTRFIKLSACLNTGGAQLGGQGTRAA